MSETSNKFTVPESGVEIDRQLLFGHLTLLLGFLEFFVVVNHDNQLFLVAVTEVGEDGGVPQGTDPRLVLI